MCVAGRFRFADAAAHALRTAARTAVVHIGFNFGTLWFYRLQGSRSGTKLNRQPQDHAQWTFIVVSSKLDPVLAIPLHRARLEAIQLWELIEVRLCTRV